MLSGPRRVGCYLDSSSAFQQAAHRPERSSDAMDVTGRYRPKADLRLSEKLSFRRIFPKSQSDKESLE